MDMETFLQEVTTTGKRKSLRSLVNPRKANEGYSTADPQTDFLDWHDIESILHRSKGHYLCLAAILP